MFISTCGFGSTGSSAVSDYLLECDGVQVFDNVEFTLATMPDGLEDLEYHVMKQNSRLFSSMDAILKFRKLIKTCSKEWYTCTPITKEQIEKYTDDFLDEIIQLRFIGDPPINDCSFLEHYFGYSILMHRIIYKLEKKKKLKTNKDYYPLREVCASVKPKNFYEAARKYVKNLLTAMGCNMDGVLVLDQAFTGNDPVKSFPFFEDSYAVVVDRDPRDLYIFAKKVLLSRGRFMPTDSVENFITYYRMLRDDQPYKLDNKRVIRISFEELVYDYEASTKKLDTFLGVVNRNRKTIFNPELSVANTNLVRKFPEFEADVRIIERELPEYLFHFEDYPEVDGGTEMFYGKSPLNKQ